jgi:hypothetical protein
MEALSFFGFLAGMVICLVVGIVSMTMTWKMVAAVNARLPESEHYGNIERYPGKWSGLIREYRRLYPDGRLADHMLFLYGGIVLLGVCAAWVVGMHAVQILFLAIGGSVGLWFVFRE